MKVREPKRSFKNILMLRTTTITVKRKKDYENNSTNIRNNKNLSKRR